MIIFTFPLSFYIYLRRTNINKVMQRPSNFSELSKCHGLQYEKQSAASGSTVRFQLEKQWFKSFTHPQISPGSDGLVALSLTCGPRKDGTGRSLPTKWAHYTVHTLTVYWIIMVVKMLKLRLVAREKCWHRRKCRSLHQAIQTPLDTYLPSLLGTQGLVRSIGSVPQGI